MKTTQTLKLKTLAQGPIIDLEHQEFGTLRLAPRAGDLEMMAALAPAVEAAALLKDAKTDEEAIQPAAQLFTAISAAVHVACIGEVSATGEISSVTEERVRHHLRYVTLPGLQEVMQALFAPAPAKTKGSRK